MQKSGVKTLSIIDTISELAQNENEALVSMASLPVPIRPRGPPRGQPPPPPGAKARYPETNGPAMNGLSRRRNEMMHQRRGQTPEWIREIFQQAKRGNKDKLNSLLDGLEPTLVRNLTDHSGNNLLHAVCSAPDPIQILPWVTRRFGAEFAGASNDENRRGLTPIALAIKLGRLECVQWLVRNTCVRDRMSSRDGERRSLIHTAAKYGQNELVVWLSEEMNRDQLDLDQVDTAGNSPLHLAAREGRLSTLSTLLHNGAQVNIKNDLGLKPCESARINGKEECNEFLLLYESALDISRELQTSRAMQETIRNENAEIRGYFKEVLSIAKRLAKERDEMCRELGRMHESMLEIHDNMIMEIQVLAQENSSLRRNGGVKNSGSSSIEMCNSLHERWQQQQRQWFSNGGLADLEHKLMVTEEGWRKIKHQQAPAAPSNISDSYPQRQLRDRMEEVRSHSKSLCAITQQSNSDGSDLSEDETVMAASRTNISGRKKLKTPSPSPHQKSNGSLNDSVYSSLSNDMYSKIGSPVRGTPVNSSTPTKRATPEAERKLSREEFLIKMKEYALTSESGNASVIEVIEPTSSEEEEFKKSMQEMNLSWGAVKTPPVTSPRRTSRSPRSPAANHFGSDVPPTKRLLEMGISALALDNNSSTVSKNGLASEPDLLRLRDVRQDDEPNDEEFENESIRSEMRSRKKKTFLQKISLKSKWNKKSKDKEKFDDAEEHILPDTFEEVSAADVSSHSLTITLGDAHKDDTAKEANQTHLYRKSLSPSSRKSVFSSLSKSSSAEAPPSVATSDDSGIIASSSRPSSSSSAHPYKQPSSGDSSDNGVTVDSPPSSGEYNFKLGKIEEASVSSSRCSSAVESRPPKSKPPPVPTKPKMTRRRENKAWYDVSDEDQEVVEPDSLSSLISTRHSSDEEL